MPYFCHPLFGNDAERTVVQPHRLLALLDRPQQARQADLGIAELSGAVDAEPIDAGVHLHGEPAGGAVKAALGLDMPTFAGQYPHHSSELVGRQLQVGAVGFPAFAKAQLLEPGERLILRAKIAGHQAALLLLIKAAAAMLVRHHRAVIIEGQLRGEALAAPIVVFTGF